MSYTLMGPEHVRRDDDGAMLSDNGSPAWAGYQAWVAAGNTPAAAPVPPTPGRAAALSALLDPLSAAQRGAITADHMQRLQAEAADHPAGLPVGNAKVARAAADIRLTPAAWFDLANC